MASEGDWPFMFPTKCPLDDAVREFEHLKGKTCYFQRRYELSDSKYAERAVLDGEIALFFVGAGRKLREIQITIQAFKSILRDDSGGMAWNSGERSVLERILFKLEAIPVVQQLRKAIEADNERVEKLKADRPGFVPEITLEEIFELPVDAMEDEYLERTRFLSWFVAG